MRVLFGFSVGSPVYGIRSPVGVGAVASALGVRLEVVGAVVLAGAGVGASATLGASDAVVGACEVAGAGAGTSAQEVGVAGVMVDGAVVVVVVVGAVVIAHGSTGAGACCCNAVGAELVGVAGMADGCAVATAPPPVATRTAIMPAVRTARGVEENIGFRRGGRTRVVMDAALSERNTTGPNGGRLSILKANHGIHNFTSRRKPRKQTRRLLTVAKNGCRNYGGA
ncbi:hypothetical protein HQ308_06765 [Rhodococcus sp. BP-241]|uniref:hypothetical protein n=1 Tax=Rhodococcus sp. BP-241 TaxID=2739441 RepID=UPI001C9AE012|nr:hypothetical protein [Rhodococcus sp. BP-241]MBY6706498.1 hypothetical protein [Rhodococcus sp. BP-241]